MSTNVEIKAKIGDFSRLKQLVEKLSDTPCEVLVQEDTFFNISRGRLKLRVLAADRGQLIFYEREDSPAPKQSDYVISTTSEPSSLKAVLTTALGIRGIVRKRRLVYEIGETRIHLDEVEGLGTFVELEVVLGTDESVEGGETKAVKLMAKLGIEQGDLVEGAYIDLLSLLRSINA